MARVVTYTIPITIMVVHGDGAMRDEHSGGGSDRGDQGEVTEEDIVGFLEKQLDWTLDVDASAVYGAGVCCLPFPDGYGKRVRALRAAGKHCRMLYVALLTGGDNDAHIDQIATCLHALYSCADCSNGDTSSSSGSEGQGEGRGRDAELVIGLPVSGLADIGNVALRREVQLLLGVSGAGIEKWANAIGALNMMRASVGASKIKFLECGDVNDPSVSTSDEMDDETRSIRSLPPLQSFPAATFFDCIGVLLPPPSPGASLRDHKIALSVAAALFSDPSAASLPSPHGPSVSDDPTPRKLLLLFADAHNGVPCSWAVASAGTGLARRFVAAIAAGKLIDESGAVEQGTGALVGAVEIAAVSSYDALFNAAQCVVLLESCSSHTERVEKEKMRMHHHQQQHEDGGGEDHRDTHPVFLTYTCRTCATEQVHRQDH